MHQSVDFRDDAVRQGSKTSRGTLLPFGGVFFSLQIARDLSNSTFLFRMSLKLLIFSAIFTVRQYFSMNQLVSLFLSVSVKA